MVRETDPSGTGGAGSFPEPGKPEEQGVEEPTSEDHFASRPANTEWDRTMEDKSII